MSAEIKIVKDNTNEVKKALEQGIKAGLTAVGLQASKYAASAAPVDTGRLRASITSQVEGDTAYIGTNVEYAPYQEFGTSKISAKHFLKNAVFNHTDEYKRIIEAMLRN